MNEEGKQLTQAKINIQEDPKASGRGVVDVRFWDCDSSLYDSFELKSFKRQLDSAIASRSLSMPRVAQAVSRTSVPQQPRNLQGKSSSRISRSLRKLLRPFFSREKPKTGPMYGVDGRSEDGYYVLYESSGRLLTVVPHDQFADRVTANSLAISPAVHADARVRRAESERFTGRISGVSCA